MDMHREEVQPGWAKGNKVFVVPVVNVEVDPKEWSGICGGYVSITIWEMDLQRQRVFG